MKSFIKIAIFSFISLNISSCSMLEKMEKDRLERERQELAQMRSYNPSLVNFFEKEMKPLLKSKGRLAKSDTSFYPNDPKLNLKEKFMEVSWKNNVGFLLTGHVVATNIDRRKVAIAHSTLTSKYRNYIEKKGGTIKEENKDKAKKITGNRIPLENCIYDAPLFGYVKNNLDSVFLRFACRDNSVIGGKDKRGVKHTLKETTFYYRVVDGVMVEKKLLGLSSFLSDSNTPSLKKSLGEISDSGSKLKDSIVDFLLHPMD